MENEFNEAVKHSAPPVGVSALTLFNVQLADWVYILTAIYLVLQIVYLVMKIIRR